MAVVAKSTSHLPVLSFKHCPVLLIEDRRFFIWTLSDEVKNKIRDFLEQPNLKFGFNSVLEQVPPFTCPDCGVDITFFDNVRASMAGGPHAKAFIVKALQQSDSTGNGMNHHITCENNHPQLIPLGWPITFGYYYDIEGQ